MKTVRQKYTYVLALLLVVVVGWAVARLPRGTGEAPGVAVAIAQPAPAPPAPGGQALPADEEALLVAWVQASEGVTVPRVAGERRSGAEAAVDPLPEPPENVQPVSEYPGLYGGQHSPHLAQASRFSGLDAYQVTAGVVCLTGGPRTGGFAVLCAPSGEVLRWLGPADVGLLRKPAYLQLTAPAEPPYAPAGNDWTPEERLRTWFGPLAVLRGEVPNPNRVPLPGGGGIMEAEQDSYFATTPQEQGWVAAVSFLDSPRPRAVTWLGLNGYQDQGLLLVTSDGAGESATQVLPARTAPELGLPAGQVASIGYSYPMVALDGQSVYALWAGEYGRQVDADYVPPTSQGRQRLALRLHALVRWTPPAAPAVIDAVAILAPAPATPEGEAQAKMAWLLDDEGRFSERSGAPFWVDNQKMEPLAYRTQTPGGVAWTRLGVDRRLVEVD